MCSVVAVQEVIQFPVLLDDGCERRHLGEPYSDARELCGIETVRGRTHYCGLEVMVNHDISHGHANFTHFHLRGASLAGVEGSL